MRVQKQKIFLQNRDNTPFICYTTRNVSYRTVYRVHANGTHLFNYYNLYITR